MQSGGQAAVGKAGNYIDPAAVGFVWSSDLPAGHCCRRSRTLVGQSRRGWRPTACQGLTLDASSDRDEDRAFMSPGRHRVFDSGCRIRLGTQSDGVLRVRERNA